MGGLVIISGPTSDVISLAEAKAHLRQDPSADEDGLLAGYILAAREYCERFTNRTFVKKTLELRIDDGWPFIWDRYRCQNRSRIILQNGPLISVTSIIYYDNTGIQQTLTDDQYIVSVGDVNPYIEQAYGITWPTVQNRLDAIAVRYDAGYSVDSSMVPEPIRQAILLLIGHWYENRTAVVAELRVVPAEMPLGVKALLQPYCTDGWP